MIAITKGYYLGVISVSNNWKRWEWEHLFPLFKLKQITVNKRNEWLNNEETQASKQAYTNK